MPSPFSIDPKNFDESVKAADDFFGYVNNRWLRDNPIPADEARWGSFYTLGVEVEKQLKTLFEELDANAGELGPTVRKVRDFHRTGMDAARLNADGDKPLAPLVKMVNDLRGADDLPQLIGFLHRRGIDVFWGSGADADMKESGVMALYMSQAGLGLPDRDYYLKDDEKSREIREKYLAYMNAMLEASPAARGSESRTKQVFELETALARASMTRVELRDLEKQYHKMAPAEIAALAPRVQWDAYFKAAEIKSPAYAIVTQPKFMEEVNREFAEIPLEDIKAYLRWSILNTASNFLGEDFEKRHFDFYGRTFSGATEMRPRWRRVGKTVGSMLDQAVGKAYAERYFSESAKKRIDDLVDHLVIAYRVRIEKLDWMSDVTKEKAKMKLAAVKKKLAYPDKWKEYAPLEIGTDSYFANYMGAYAFEFDRHTKQIGGPTDKDEWHMPPQMVNACYDFLRNDVLFPAAILQPPFFYPDGDDAVNFGAIGSVIGHELTHGFDDQGGRFDADGNMNDWWTKEDRERFDAKTAHLAEQFDAYEPLPGLRVNGKLTLGENIADLGGALIAYDGLMLALQEKPQPPIDGLAPARRFFIGFALQECIQSREENLRTQIQTDPHSPSRYRVNGPLSNMSEFYEAFGAKQGDKLWRDPEDRVKIW